MEVTLDTALTTAAQTLALDVAGTTFAFEDADSKTSFQRFWNNSGLSWSAGDAVVLKLTETAPTITDTEVTSSPASGDTYRHGETIAVTVTFSEAVDVTGTVLATLWFSQSTSTYRSAPYVRGSGTTALVFEYTVAEGDTDTDGLQAGPHILAQGGDPAMGVQGGGTITRKDASTVAADLTSAALFSDADHKVDGSRTVPGAPVLTATANGETQIDLSWIAPSNTGGAAITQYHIEVSADGGTNWTALINLLGAASTTTHSHTGLTAGNTRHYRVRAVNSVGNGAWSSVESATTAATVTNSAPTFTSVDAFSVAENTTAVGTVAATDPDSEDTVSYFVVSGGDDDSAKFRIDSGTGALTFAAAPDYDRPADVASTTPMNTAANNEYIVAIEVYSGTGARFRDANQTITVTVTNVIEPPAAPSEPSVTPDVRGTLIVVWAPPSNMGPDITDYDYRYRVLMDPPSGPWSEVTTTAITGIRAAITGLAADTGYEAQVRATNPEGTSDWSASGTGTTPSMATVPGAPTGLTATANGGTQIDLSWTAPADTGGTNITDYNVDFCARTPAECDRIEAWERLDEGIVSTATTYSHTGLTAGTTRHYRVRAVNSVGDGAWSNVKRATTTAAATVTAPGAPTGLSATVGNARVTLRWTAPTSNGGAAITRYEYETNGGGAWQTTGGKRNISDPGRAVAEDDPAVGIGETAAFGFAAHALGEGGGLAVGIATGGRLDGGRVGD